jgi:hypothetical protein
VPTNIKIRNYFTIGDRTVGGLLRKITVNFPFFREIVTEKHVLNWWTIGKSSINIPIQRRKINRDTPFFYFALPSGAFTQRVVESKFQFEKLMDPNISEEHM